MRGLLQEWSEIVGNDSWHNDVLGNNNKRYFEIMRKFYLYIPLLNKIIMLRNKKQ